MTSPRPSRSSPLATPTPASAPGPSGYRRSTRRRAQCSRERDTTSTPRPPRWRSTSTATTPKARELDWSTDADIATVARLNDDSYGFSERSFSAALRPLPGGVARIYVAHLDGSPASCLVTHDHEGDCGIYFVATRPEARGRGLAGELLDRALGDARARGCETSSLQATTMGEPVYARLGYRSLGRLHMWERRARGASRPQPDGGLG